MTSIFLGVAALVALLVSVRLLLDVTTGKRALPRMVVTPGIVRELDTSVAYEKTGGKRGFTRLHVDFKVNGQDHICRRLWFFAGNRHVGDPGKLYSFPAGTEVGVYYDPEDPRRNALILDQPRYGVAVIAAALGVFFIVLAVLTSE